MDLTLPTAKGAEYQENSVNIFEYFTSACYSGFNDDDDESFYSVYRWDVFKISLAIRNVYPYHTISNDNLF